MGSTAAHAGAQRDHDGAAAALCRAHPDLAQRSHVGVVAHQHPDAAQQLAELNGDVAVAPSELYPSSPSDKRVQKSVGWTLQVSFLRH